MILVKSPDYLILYPIDRAQECANKVIHDIKTCRDCNPQAWNVKVYINTLRNRRLERFPSQNVLMIIISNSNWQSSLSAGLIRPEISFSGLSQTRAGFGDTNVGIAGFTRAGCTYVCARVRAAIAIYILNFAGCPVSAEVDCKVETSKRHTRLEHSHAHPRTPSLSRVYVQGTRIHFPCFALVSIFKMDKNF